MQQVRFSYLCHQLLYLLLELGNFSFLAELLDLHSIANTRKHTSTCRTNTVPTTWVNSGTVPTTHADRVIDRDTVYTSSTVYIQCCICIFIPTPQSTWSTRSRDTHDIHYLKCRTTLGQKSFVLHAALFCNALPNDLKSSVFISQFDRGFKRLLDYPVCFERYRAILFDNIGNV